MKTGPAKNEHIWDIAGEHNDSVTLTISSSWPPTGSKKKTGIAKLQVGPLNQILALTKGALKGPLNGTAKLQVGPLNG